jgi:heat shock protein HslJ/DNA-binding protein
MKQLIISTLALTGMVITLISSSCDTSKKASEIDMSESFKSHPSAYQTDYTAGDTDSTWKLSIRFGEEIVFTSKSEKINFRGKASPEIVAQGANIVKVGAQNETHSIVITIDVAKCNKNGFVTDVQVQDLKTSTKIDFSGCGQYNGSPQLFDIWVLTDINDETLHTEMFRKQTPYMEINLREKTIAGFGGCNDFSGELSFSYKKMEVGPIAATKIYCAEESKIEKEFFTILNAEPVIYVKKENRLILENSAGSLIFKKVD